MSTFHARQGIFLIIVIVGFVVAGLIIYERRSAVDQDRDVNGIADITRRAAPAAGEKGKLVYNPKTVIHRPFRAIKNAKFIAADEVGEKVADKELVMGVVIDGKAKAYPINMLCGPSREIVNDTLGSRAIAATW